MENDFNYGSYGYIAVLDFNTAEKFASIEPRVSVQYMQQAIEKNTGTLFNSNLYRNL